MKKNLEHYGSMPIIVGVGEEGFAEEAAHVIRAVTLRTAALVPADSCAGRLLAVNAICTPLRDPIKSVSTRLMIRPECGE